MTPKILSDLDCRNCKMPKALHPRASHCVGAMHAVINDLRRQLADVTRERELLSHKIITCGVAATHPDTALSRRGKDYGGPWDSPQAEEVRELRAQRDALVAAGGELMHEWELACSDYSPEDGMERMAEATGVFATALAAVETKET